MSNQTKPAYEISKGDRFRPSGESTIYTAESGLYESVVAPWVVDVAETAVGWGALANVVPLEPEDIVYIYPPEPKPEPVAGPKAGDRVAVEALIPLVHYVEVWGKVYQVEEVERFQVDGEEGVRVTFAYWDEDTEEEVYAYNSYPMGVTLVLAEVPNV